MTMRARGGRRRAGRCPSHVAPCSRRGRRGGRMCVHAASFHSHNPPRLATMFPALHWPGVDAVETGEQPAVRAPLKLPQHSTGTCTGTGTVKHVALWLDGPERETCGALTSLAHRLL